MNKNEIEVFGDRKNIVIENIFQLFDALAAGWEENKRNRRIVASNDYNRIFQVVREPYTCIYPADRVDKKDIVIDSGGVGMTGFIKHETRCMFDGLFIVSECEGIHYASLTKSGFEYAKSGVVDIDFERLKIYPFFNPPAKKTGQDVVLAKSENSIFNRRIASENL